MKKPTVARAAPSVPTGPHFVFHAKVTRVETSHVPVGPGGEHSVGSFVDQYFAGVAEDGGSVEHFELELSPDVFRGIYGAREDQSLAEPA